MRSRLNNILIGLLWLSAVSLGASFWFNIKYGFNIFSVQHWQYLAYMQASNQPVRASFYISFLVIIAVAIFGLYKLLQPRIRKIFLPKTTKIKSTHLTQTVDTPAPPVTEPPNPDSTPEKNTTISGSGPVRPPRLNITPVARTTAPVPYVPLSSGNPNKTIDPDQEYADIHEIFTSAGFLYKGSPRIKGMQTSVIAIGTGEILWIGATGVSTSDMQRAVDTLRGVFTDTLEDIEININAFIINATDKNSDTSIMQFATVDDLRKYISEHPNIPPTDDEIENFDAYSGYIGTVIDYIGKI